MSVESCQQPDPAGSALDLGKGGGGGREHSTSRNNAWFLFYFIPPIVDFTAFICFTAFTAVMCAAVTQLNRTQITL